MRNIRISARLFLGFSLLIVLLLAMSSIGVWRILDAEKDAAAIQRSQLINTTIMHWARNVHLNGERAQAVPNIVDKQALADFQSRMTKASSQIDEYQNQVDQLLKAPEARALFDNVLTARSAYTGPRAAALQDLNNGNEQKANNFFKNQMPNLIANYVGSIEKVYEYQLDHQDSLYAENYTENRLSLWVLGIATLVSLILGPLFSYLISRSIINPLGNAVDLAATVANQDLTVDITPLGNDEITQLQISLSDMVNNLRNAVGNVLVGADTIAQAAKEISDGNIDLSSRTDEQASSLAQTAASMEEITATVRQSADNAQQANSLSVEASTTAQDGGKMVDGLVHTMAEINTKAQ